MIHKEKLDDKIKALNSTRVFKKITPKFDLSYPGYNNGANNHDHPYDRGDEGLSYKNVGRYAKSLQGWWRLEEGTGIIAYDSSGKNRDGELVNSPTWSGSYAPGPY